MADITNDIHPPRLSPPFSEESSLSGPVSPRIPTQPSTHTSSSGRLDISSPSRIVPRSPSPVSGTQYGDEVEAVASAQEMKTARELRERGRRCKREMHVARDLAKSARKSGDYKAKPRHKHDAMAYESQMKNLDKRAAKIIFREKENNKVRGHPLRYQSRAQPLLCQGPKGRNGRPSWPLYPGSPRVCKEGTPNLQLIGTMTRSASSLVRLSSAPCIIRIWCVMHRSHSQAEGSVPINS
jgi:hypothetical protein